MVSVTLHYPVFYVILHVRDNWMPDLAMGLLRPRAR